MLYAELIWVQLLCKPNPELSARQRQRRCVVSSARFSWRPIVQIAIKIRHQTTLSRQPRRDRQVRSGLVEKQPDDGQCIEAAACYPPPIIPTTCTFSALRRHDADRAQASDPVCAKIPMFFV